MKRKPNPTLRGLFPAELQQRIANCQQRIVHRMPGQSVRAIKAWRTRYENALIERRGAP